MASSLFVLLGLLVALASGYTTMKEASVFEERGRFYLVDGIDTSAVAFGSFNDTIDISGWGVLKIETNSSYDDLKQMFAAGFLEGALTSARIYENYLNIQTVFFSNGTPPAVVKFFEDQAKWANSKTENYGSLSDYWKQAAMILNQFNGLMQGYKTAGDTPLDTFAFQMLNGCGDLFDIIPAVNIEARMDWDSMDTKEITRTLSKNGHCSAIIKVDGALSDLWASHSSWFVYGAMNRIYKHYNFNLNAAFVSAKRMSFSSYPGFLESLDDFYIMDNGLVMVQTSNNIINYTIYEHVTPKSLLAWQRVRLANSMAKDGNSWGELFSQHNSGTYTNQYMVVDYNKFQKGVAVEHGTLTVIEQIPGLVIYEDQTHQLERGYWASYNVPYYEKIYDLSGYPALVAKNGPTFSYQMAPRAQIFRRDQAHVVDLETLKTLMRSNNYETDPYSHGDPGNAICSRFDLEPVNPSPVGCYDTKVTNSELMTQLISYAINGPTTNNGTLPPFSWNSKFNSTNHYGQPQTFDFDFIEMNPQW